MPVYHAVFSKNRNKLETWRLGIVCAFPSESMRFDSEIEEFPFIDNHDSFP
jgi:hypothetical protein